MASDVSDDSEFEDAVQNNDESPARLAANQQEQARQNIRDQEDQQHEDNNDNVQEADPLPMQPNQPQQQQEAPAVGLNAHEIVRQVIDNLWPVVRNAHVAAEDE